VPFASVQTWIDLGLLLGAGLAVYVAVLVVSTALRLVRPPRRTYAWAVARGVPGDPGELPEALAFTEFTVHRRGRELKVWDVEGRSPDGPTVVITHGWGSSRIGAMDRIGAIAPLVRRVITWDLPGHGDSGGWCTLGALEGDDLLAVASAADVRGPLVLFGWSLGAEVTLDAARRAGDLSILGVVIEGAYSRGVTPARNVMRLAQHPWRVNLGPALALVGLLTKGDPLFRFRRCRLSGRGGSLPRCLCCTGCWT
jgi:pimeloyl-ACP methyl ester carboxylesterase